jgi:hypothetical protein
LRGAPAQQREFDPLVRELLGELVSAESMQAVLCRWVLLEAQPEIMRNTPRLTAMDIAMTSVREYLAIAIPLGAVSAEKIDQSTQGHSRATMHATAVLNIDESTLYRLQWQANVPFQRTRRIEWHLRHVALCKVQTRGLAMAWHLVHLGDWDGLVVRLHR